MSTTPSTEIEQAQKRIEAHMSPRYRAIDELERWVDGKQYEGLPNFFEDGQGARPLFERAPCIRYLLVKAAIESNVDIILGEGRFPTVTSNPGEDDTLFDDELGLDEEDSKKLDRGIQVAFKQSRFKIAAREVLRDSQRAKSAAAVLCLRDGKLCWNTLKAKWCTPEFDLNGNVTRVVIEYPYTYEYQDEAGKWHTKAMVYHREIDETTDTTFKPAEANEFGSKINWVADEKQTYVHGFGFCPVRWYAHLRGCSTEGTYDGHAIHEDHCPEIKALDMALSMRHRAALKCSDPQWVECGVEPGFNPTESGDNAIIPATPSGGVVNTRTNPAKGGYKAGGGTGVRKRGPNVVWQYQDKDTKVQQFTLPGDALKALSEHATDLRGKLGELLCHVFLDPEAVKFASALSGKAMSAFRERQYNRCDQIRDDFGDSFLIPCTLMMLRVIAHFGISGALRLKGLRTIVPIIERFIGDVPELNLIWGGYTKPDPDDEKKIVDTVVAAKTGGLITQKMGLQKLKSANIFSIENVDQAAEALQEEIEEAQEKSQAHEHALATAISKSNLGSELNLDYELNDTDDGGSGDKSSTGSDAEAREGKPSRARARRDRRAAAKRKAKQLHAPGLVQNSAS